nr:hypothetical protein [Tanacetum cinerariifolium]
MTSLNQRECVGCGQPCDGFYCYLCTCQQCGDNLINGICLNCTYGDGKPVTCCRCECSLNGRFCLFCASRAENSFTYDPSNSFDDSQNLSDYPPQPQYQTYSCELCGNDAHYGYDCPPQVSFVYNQDTEYLENSSNAITPDLPTAEPDNSLNHFEILSDFNDDCTLSDDDSFEDVDYVEASPPDFELVSLEEVKDDILREKLLNINLLIAKIESLNDNLTPDCVLKSPSPFPIPDEDTDC